MCCFYFTIDKAVEIIGYWLFIELLGQYFYVNPILIIVNLGAIAFWGLMHRKDSEKNRRNFFYAFTIWMLTAAVFAIMEGYKKATSDE